VLLNTLLSELDFDVKPTLVAGEHTRITPGLKAVGAAVLADDRKLNLLEIIQLFG
jgi:hypothetical protein